MVSPLSVSNVSSSVESLYAAPVMIEPSLPLTLPTLIVSIVSPFKISKIKSSFSSIVALVNDKLVFSKITFLTTPTLVASTRLDSLTNNVPVPSSIYISSIVAPSTPSKPFSPLTLPVIATSVLSLRTNVSSPVTSSIIPLTTLFCSIPVKGNSSPSVPVKVNV